MREWSKHEQAKVIAGVFANTLVDEVNIHS